MVKIIRNAFVITALRILRVVFGVVLIAIGILGFILPLLPGWPFLASGIIILWPKSRLAAWLKKVPGRIRDRLRKRSGAPGAVVLPVTPEVLSGRDQL